MAAALDTIAALRQSLDRADFDEISRQVHNLKGSSLFLGIDALTGMARLLELAAQRKAPPWHRRQARPARGPDRPDRRAPADADPLALERQPPGTSMKRRLASRGARRLLPGPGRAAGISDRQSRWM
ncbi:MAG: Hpt domain-containing protein [Myxococcales bacterium]|nr:Hpt domain-containing protein [Myxococcales bacterium]